MELASVCLKVKAGIIFGTAKASRVGEICSLVASLRQGRSAIDGRTEERILQMNELALGQDDAEGFVLSAESVFGLFRNMGMLKDSSPRTRQGPRPNQAS